MIEVDAALHLPPAEGSAAFEWAVSFTAGAGVTALFGPSGSGKSLTLNAIAGLMRPDRGRIAVNGTPWFDAGQGVHLAPRRRACGYVFQQPALFPHMSLRDNLAFALPQRNADAPRLIDEMLTKFRLAGLGARLPRQLSGGQQRRAAIARALLRRPEVLLLDEPTQGLDAPLRAELYDVLRRVRAEFNTALLLVTHDLAECCELAEEVVVLRTGKVVQVGAPLDVVNHPVDVGLARVLGLDTILPVQVESLGTVTGRGLVRLGEASLPTPPLPGITMGERAWLLLRPTALRALPPESAPADAIKARVRRVTAYPDGLLVEYDGGLRVAGVPVGSVDTTLGTTHAVVIPPAAVRVLPGHGKAG